MTISPQDLAYWTSLYGERTYPTAEIVVITNNVLHTIDELGPYFNSNRITAGKVAESDSDLPLLEGREMLNGQTTYFLCYDKACQLPVNSVKELADQIASN